MITDVLHRLANHRQSLSRAEAREAMAEVLAEAVQTRKSQRSWLRFT
jgi:hypothetical protein